MSSSVKRTFPHLFLLFLLLDISLVAGKKSFNDPKAVQPKNKPKPQEKTAQQKDGTRKSGLVFEETSKEKIKSVLDTSLGVLGPWKQNAGDLYTGCLSPQIQQNKLLNQPANPVMRINGYPVNPKGAKSLAQSLDGSLEEEQDFREVMSQLKAGPPMSNNIRPYRPIGMARSGWRPLRPVGMPALQRMMGNGGMIGAGMMRGGMIRAGMMRGGGMSNGGMLGNVNVNDGYRREKTEQFKKKNDIFQNIHDLIRKKMMEKRIQRLQARRAKFLKSLKNSNRAVMSQVYC